MEIIKYNENQNSYMCRPGDVFEWNDVLYRVHAIFPPDAIASACALCCFQSGSNNCSDAPGCGTMDDGKYYTVADPVQMAIEIVKEAEDGDNKI